MIKLKRGPDEEICPRKYRWGFLFVALLMTVTVSLQIYEYAGQKGWFAKIWIVNLVLLPLYYLIAYRSWRAKG
ncbi:MAG: hypothetical protein QM680_07070 [Luteolibacter sp.]